MERDLAWLRERVAFLAETPADAERLERVLAAVARVDDDDGTLTCTFARGGPWVIEPPRPIRPETPPSLARVLRGCGGMSFDEVGTVQGLSLHDGWSGTLSVMGDDLAPRLERDGFGLESDPCAPIDVGLMGYYVFDPRSGAMCRYDHEGGVQEPEAGATPASVWLRELADAVEEASS